jgi:hypothetical protein
MNHIQFEAAEARINQIISNQLTSIENMETKPGIDVNEIESLLWDIAKKLNDRIEHLDPNVSGQDDEINQLENIQAFLNEAHSEVFIYDRDRARGKYTNK